MKIREIFNAVQWFPEEQHPAVTTTVLGSGMNRQQHRDIAEQLDAGQGQVGAIYMMLPTKKRAWLLVYPGDWIITRPGPIYELCRQAEFAKKYEVI